MESKQPSKKQKPFVDKEALKKSIKEHKKATSSNAIVQKR